MRLRMAKRTDRISSSLIHEVNKKANNISILELAAGKEKEIISFAIGDPNFELPYHIKKAITNGLDSGFTKYTDAAGISSLREACAENFRKSGINATIENTIVSSGSKILINAVLWALINEGEEVIVPSPYYPSFVDMVLSYGGYPQLLCTERDNFQLKSYMFKSAITENTKAIILNSPNNPTGKIWDWEEFKEFPPNIWVIVDECYHRIIYDNKNYVSFASLKGRENQTITIRSFSKTFRMTGLRIGYLTGPEEVVKKITTYLEMGVGCPCSLSQKAALAALQGDQSHIKEMINELDNRRKELMNWLDKKGISYPKPEGAFYIFIDVSKYGSSIEVSNRLLKEAGIVVTPGTAFGKYNNYIRLSFASVNKEEIEEALERMEKILC